MTIRVADIADVIGKHRNTINKWINEYSEFFSEQLPNETRYLTDEDLRVILFINDLVEKKFNKAGITQALQDKRTRGIPLPPVNPEILATLSGTYEDSGLIPIPAEIEGQLEDQAARLEEQAALIEQLTADNERMKGELSFYQKQFTEALRRNEELNITIGQLQEQIRSLENVPQSEAGRQEIERLKRLLDREGGKVSEYKKRQQNLYDIISDLNKKLSGDA